MKAKVHKEDNSYGIVVYVNEESFDLSVVDDFKNVIGEIEFPIKDDITIDLEAVEMIDSSAIGSLLSIHKKMSQDSYSNSNVVLRSVNKSVMSVLEVLRLNRIFRIEVTITSMAEKG